MGTLTVPSTERLHSTFFRKLALSYEKARTFLEEMAGLVWRYE